LPRVCVLARLGELGERAVLRRVEGLLAPQWRCRGLGPGDDAVCAGEGLEDLVVKIDGGSIGSSLAPWMSYADLGWQWVTATASDLVAKAAKPLIFLLSVGLDPGLEEDSLYQLVGGAIESAERHGAWLGGGDTNSSRGDGWVDVAGLGRVVRLPAPGRRAQPGDLVYVTLGRLGLSGLVLHSLATGDWESARQVFPEAFKEFTRPVARLGFLGLYRELGSDCVTAALDISDGLAETLYQLSEKSSRVIELRELPLVEEAVEYAKNQGIDYDALLLYGGQEYEVVFTARPGCAHEVEGTARRNGVSVAQLGYVTEKPGTKVLMRGKVVRRAGWDNLKRDNPAITGTIQ